MPLTIRRQQFAHPFAYESATVNPEVAAEVLEYLFNTTAWKTNAELLPRKVRQWRERLFSAAAPAASVPAPLADADRHLAAAPASMGASVVPPAGEEDDWVLRAVELKRQGMGWSKVSQEIGRPRATVRRVVEAEFRARGEAVPLGGSE